MHILYYYYNLFMHLCTWNLRLNPNRNRTYNIDVGSQLQNAQKLLPVIILDENQYSYKVLYLHMLMYTMNRAFCLSFVYLSELLIMYGYNICAYGYNNTERHFPPTHIRCGPTFPSCVIFRIRNFLAPIALKLLQHAQKLYWLEPYRRKFFK